MGVTVDVHQVYRYPFELVVASYLRKVTGGGSNPRLHGPFPSGSAWALPRRSRCSLPGSSPGCSPPRAWLSLAGRRLRSRAATVSALRCAGCRDFLAVPAIPPRPPFWGQLAGDGPRGYLWSV